MPGAQVERELPLPFPRAVHPIGEVNSPEIRRNRAGTEYWPTRETQQGMRFGPKKQAGMTSNDFVVAFRSKVAEIGPSGYGSEWTRGMYSVLEQIGSDAGLWSITNSSMARQITWTSP